MRYRPLNTKLELIGLIKKRYSLHILAVIISMLIGLVLAMHAGQDINWDLRNYHYYNPYAFLHGHIEKDFIPAQIQTFANPLLDVPSYLLSRHLKPIVSGALIGSVQGLNIWIVFEIMLSFAYLHKRILSRVEIILLYALSIISFLGATSLTEIGGTMGDNLVSIPLLGAFWLLFRSIAIAGHSLAEKAKVRNGVIAYCLMGMSLGLKLSTAPYLAGLILADLTVSSLSWCGARHMAKKVAALTLSFLVFYGFWGSYLWRQFRSPFYPFFNNIFHSPFYSNINFSDTRFLPHGILQTLFYPFFFLHKQTHVSEIPVSDWRLAMLYITIIMIVLVILGHRFLLGSRDRRPAIFIVVFVVASYLVWLSQSSIYRYAIVLELLAIPIFYFLLSGIIGHRLKLFILLGIGILPLLFTTRPMDFGHTSWKKSYMGVASTGPTPKNATILITGYEPIAYIIPDLDQSNVFIRVQSNMTNGGLSETPKFSHKRLAMIHGEEARGKIFYSLSTRDDKDVAGEVLQYGFHRTRCLDVHTNYSLLILNNPSYYQLCLLVKSRSSIVYSS